MPPRRVFATALFSVLWMMLSASSSHAQVDFTATWLSPTPNELRVTDVIVIDATINNTGSGASGNFTVQAFLDSSPVCNGTSYLMGTQVLSLAGSSSSAFQVARMADNIASIGTYYLCLQLDAFDDVSETNENNNVAGGSAYPVYIVDCLSDPECDDSNPCTDDFCQAMVGCQHGVNIGPCDDGLFCTVNDICSGGGCQGGVARDCADIDLCDGTMFCDELAGACVNGRAPPDCDDGDQCNGAETCNPVDGACWPGTPISCDVLTNNGLAPPGASNVIDHVSYDEVSDQRVYVRNQGCPPFGDPDAFCPLPGTPTTVEVALGADVGDIEVFDTSILEVSDGNISVYSGGQDALVSLDGGTVQSGESFGSTLVTGGDHGFLRLLGPATISGGNIENLELDADFTSLGGTIAGGFVTTLFSGTKSEVRGGRVSVLCGRTDPGVIYGSDFDVNGGLFGPLPGASGFISGTLESGNRLNATYHQTGSWCYHPEEGEIETAGSFTLLPPESTFIANGLSLGGAQNTIDASDPATQFHDIFVRNAGCPDAWPTAFRDDPCSAPGSATVVEVLSGASLLGTLSVLDDSSAFVRGGQLLNLRTSGEAAVEVWGGDFSIGGTPVPFGEVLDTSGVLAGTLASGDPLALVFNREDALVPGTYGTILLRSAAELAPGNNVMESLFGGTGNTGGVALDLDIESGGFASGTYELVALEDGPTEIPDFAGLTTLSESSQEDYQIWDLDFSGILLTPSDSRIIFAYDPTLVRIGEVPTLYAWDGVEWLRILNGVVIDKVNQTISARVDSFETYALIVERFGVPGLTLGGMLLLSGGLIGSGYVACRSMAQRVRS